MVEIEIHADDAGQRADRFLRKLLAKAPLALIHRLLRTGDVRVDGRRVRPADRLVAGARVELTIDDGRFAELCGAGRARPPAPKGGGLEVLLDDPDFLVVDKPGGLAVHGGSGVGDDHLAARIAGLGAAGSATFRAAPAHRIDRGTSGIVAVGRTARGLRGLTRAFRERQAEKVYLAVVHGRPEPTTGTIEVALDIGDRGARRAKARPTTRGGAAAISHYRVLQTAHRLSLVEVVIETGRTHQVRAHLASLGHPLVGDRRYGAPAQPDLGRHRIALHAFRLAFPHPIDGHRVVVESPLPAELADLVDGRGA